MPCSKTSKYRLVYLGGGGIQIMSVLSPNSSGQLLNNQIMKIQETDSMPESQLEENSENDRDEENNRGGDGSSDESGSEDEEGVRANQLIFLTIAAGVEAKRRRDKRHIDADETFVENLIKKADGYFLTIYAKIIAGTPNPTVSKVNSVSGSKHKKKISRPGAVELESETSTSSRSEIGFEDSGSSEVSTKFPNIVTAPKTNTYSEYCHGVDKPFMCEYCGARWNTKSQYDRHLRTHTGERSSFVCQECSLAVSSIYALRTHTLLHTGELPFACPHCDKKYRQMGHLREHLAIHPGERAFPCTQCGKLCGSKLSLLKHVRLHSGERPFPCTQCEKTFKLKQHLNEHLKIHSGQELPCSQCGKTFKSRKYLVAHLKIHSVERPFPCTQCGKKFLYNSDLTKHLRTHSGKRSFACGHCTKAFSSSNILRRHLKVHTEEKREGKSHIDARST